MPQFLRDPNPLRLQRSLAQIFRPELIVDFFFCSGGSSMERRSLRPPSLRFLGDNDMYFDVFWMAMYVWNIQELEEYHGEWNFPNMACDAAWSIKQIEKKQANRKKMGSTDQHVNKRSESILESNKSTSHPPGPPRTSCSWFCWSSWSLF